MPGTEKKKMGEIPRRQFWCARILKARNTFFPTSLGFYPGSVYKRYNPRFERGAVVVQWGIFHVSASHSRALFNGSLVTDTKGVVRGRTGHHASRHHDVSGSEKTKITVTSSVVDAVRTRWKTRRRLCHLATTVFTTGNRKRKKIFKKRLVDVW